MLATPLAATSSLPRRAAASFPAHPPSSPALADVCARVCAAARRAFAGAATCVAAAFVVALRAAVLRARVVPRRDGADARGAALRFAAGTRPR